MSLLIDVHTHTNRYSACSVTPPERVIPQAVAAGLQGLILTEHFCQWPQEELDALQEEAGETGFLLLSGFEYSSADGDILVYGLPAEDATLFQPYAEARAVLEEYHRRGAVCVGAHPTRAGLGFDESIVDLPLDALEVGSVNLEPHEQRLAEKLAKNLDMRPIAGSDSHRAEDIGRYATEFDLPVQSMADFVEAVRAGAFRPTGPRLEERQ
jgi:predicted metal-dependent phosphoesterase TrpH